MLAYVLLGKGGGVRPSVHPCMFLFYCLPSGTLHEGNTLTPSSISESSTKGEIVPLFAWMIIPVLLELLQYA